jgi:cytochrome c peroxidase
MKIRVMAWAFLAIGMYADVDPTPYRFPVLPLFPPMPVRADNPVTVEGAALGKQLFFDPVLSRDSSTSCASCHRPEKAFSDAPNRFSKGVSGRLSIRNTPSLQNLAWYRDFFLDGRVTGLEEATLHPVRDEREMDFSVSGVVSRLSQQADYRESFFRAFGNTQPDSALLARALGQYLRTLLAYRSRFDSALWGYAYLSDAERHGLEAMSDQTRGNCIACHSLGSDALGVAPGFRNNGLDDVKTIQDPGLGKVTGSIQDIGRFKIPSLRNVAITGPYMHDGRFTSLEEVLRFYSEGVHPTADPPLSNGQRAGPRLTEQEQRDIIAFLEALTDRAVLGE